MRILISAAIVLTCLASCGGNTVTPGATCGAGTTAVNGQCVLTSDGTAGTTGTTGFGGTVSVGGAAGDATSGLAGAGGAEPGGGAGAGGSPPQPDQCTGHTVLATGMPGLMDDFEDGDGNILANDGRFGGWYLANNGTCTLTPASLLILPEAPVAGASVNNASKYAIHVTATGCSGFNGPSLQSPFNTFGIAGCAYDASQYDGMYFWATGNGLQLSVAVGLTTTIPAKYGGTGTCAQDATDKGCWDAFSTYVRLTPDWKEYSFKWSDLRQVGFGTKTPWDPKLTASLYISVSGNQATTTIADFSVDNVGFFKGTPPTDPPMPNQ